MSSPAVQLTFALRTSPNVRTVHLLGSWDGYKSQLPLSALKDPAAKPGSWKGTFRFQGAHALKLGSRYWYYYIVDGYHVSHDPAKEHVVEKTTGRKLNVLNVPSGDTKRPAPVSVKPEIRVRTTSEAPPKTPTSSKHQIPVGRAPSPGKIFHPRPQKPYASQGLREADYETSPIEELEERFAGTKLSDRNYLSSPSDLSDLSEGSSGTVFSSCSDSTSSCTSSDDDAGSRCRCNRFGLTRDGRRVMLDCGGKRCGYAASESSSACDSSGSDAGTSEDEVDDDDDDDDDNDYQRETELKKRARARLVAERSRNGVITTANVRLNAVVGLPATPRLPRPQHLADDANAKPSLATARPRQTREREVDRSTKTRQTQQQLPESTRARAGHQEERRRR